MAKESIGLVGDPSSKFDRFAVSLFAITFQTAEILLVVGAFRYASEKTGSALLAFLSFVFLVAGSLWLGLVVPGTVGRMSFWPRLKPWVRYVLYAVSLAASIGLSLVYMSAISELARAQS